VPSFWREAEEKGNAEEMEADIWDDPSSRADT